MKHPSNWTIKSIGEVTTIGSGKDYKHLGNGDVPVYGTGGIMTYVDSYLYDGESVGIGRKGTIDKPQFLKGKFWTVDTLFYTHSFKGATPKFLYYLFSSINWKLYNEASGVPSLSKKTIETIDVLIPPLPEQQKIAAILSKWDELIDTQTQLIAAKEKQKKGLMQKLLTGKKRFAGFTDEWKEVKLGEVFNLTSGKTKPKNTEDFQSSNLNIPVFGGNGISGYSNEFISSGDVILIGRVGEYCGSVHFVRDNCWITDNCLYTIDFSDENDIEYFSFLLKYLDLGRLRNKGGQPLVSQKPILNLGIRNPQIQEQQKIASVLTAADKEIELLKKELESLQQQKKGLMQQLLTGKIRVSV